MNTPPLPTTKTRRRTLRSQADIRRALAWVACELEAGRIAESTARTLGYLYQTLSSIHERHELEAELEAVKKSLEVAGLEVAR